jgi:uncharacterized protein (TIGR02594 family)
MTQEALKLLGTIETPGSGDNPTIMAWAREIGVQKTYTADAVPWCGLFMGVVAHRAGKQIPSTPLWALSWAQFGVDEGQPRLGDVLVFTRNGGGHVTQYVAEDQTAFHCLGGNQGDKVCIERIAKARLYRVRRPAYSVMPASARPYVVQPTGNLSENEQ